MFFPVYPHVIVFFYFFFILVICIDLVVYTKEDFADSSFLLLQNLGFWEAYSGSFPFLSFSFISFSLFH